MALVEYIAHLSLRDWAAVPEDLRRLGFISADAPDSSVIAEPLGRILGQISVGAARPPGVPRCNSCVVAQCKSGWAVAWHERPVPEHGLALRCRGRSQGGESGADHSRHRGADGELPLRDSQLLCAHPAVLQRPGCVTCCSMCTCTRTRCSHTVVAAMGAWLLDSSCTVMHRVKWATALFIRCRGYCAACGPQLQHRAGVLPVPGPPLAAGQRPTHPGTHEERGSIPLIHTADGRAA
jgi:hypothetical protein